MVSIADASLLNDLESQREQELAEARAIQIGMLPHGPLQTADVTVCYEFQPFHEVGGDFLDFFTLTDGVIGIYLGDVTGEGLPAALYAALAMGTLRGVHKTGTPPAAVLGILNQSVMLRGVSSPRYAAVQYGCFDPRTGILRIASAGMAGPLILSAQGYRELELRGIPPGMFHGGGLRERNRSTGTWRFDGFSERWIQRIAEFPGRLFWHGESAGGVRAIANKDA